MLLAAAAALPLLLPLMPVCHACHAMPPLLPLRCRLLMLLLMPPCLPLLSSPPLRAADIFTYDADAEPLMSAIICRHDIREF